MRQIVYISTARSIPSDEDLNQILAQSRRNNKHVGVTGLLVVGGRRFLQALEGPSQAVQATFDRILADPRHFAVVTLSDKETDSRSFGEWAMAFETGGSGDDEIGLGEAVEQLVAPLANSNLRAEFRSFAELHGRA